MVWYGMVWYGMVWYGMVWYGMVWYGRRQYVQTNGNMYKQIPKIKLTNDFFPKDAKNGELLATAFSAFTLPGNANRISTKIQKDTNCNVDEYDRRKSYGEYDRRKSYEEYDRRKSYEVPLDSLSDIYQLRELEHRAPNQDETSNSQTSKDVASLRKELYHFVSSRELEVFITFCIVANTVVMATEHYGMSSTLDTVISVSNYVSSFI
jgi:hypothetical protein